MVSKWIGTISQPSAKEIERRKIPLSDELTKIQPGKPRKERAVSLRNCHKKS
jgi:hypothetical protein